MQDDKNWGKILEIITVNSEMDEVLKEKCEPLKVFDLNTVTFMNSLMMKLDQTEGVGLAAPQVGVSMRGFVMKCQSGQRLKVLNPKITSFGKIINSKQEGCLSIPGKRFNKKRAKRVRVEFRNEIGEFIKMHLRNFDAFVFQHELDHLNGILISD